MILSFFSAPASWGILTKVVIESMIFPASKTVGCGRTLLWVPFMTFYDYTHGSTLPVTEGFSEFEQGSKGLRKHPLYFCFRKKKDVSSFIRFCEQSLSGLVFFYNNLVLVDSWILKDMVIQISQEFLLKLVVLF